VDSIDRRWQFLAILGKSTSKPTALLPLVIPPISLAIWHHATGTALVQALRMHRMRSLSDKKHHYYVLDSQVLSRKTPKEHSVGTQALA
jgi:hypothetical protein